MNDEQKRELAEVMRRELQPLERKLERLNGVLLEGDDKLGIPSLVKRVTMLEGRAGETSRRLRRLEVAGALAVVVTAAALAVNPDVGVVIARLLGILAP